MNTQNVELLGVLAAALAILGGLVKFGLQHHREMVLMRAHMKEEQEQVWPRLEHQIGALRDEIMKQHETPLSGGEAMRFVKFVLMIAGLLSLTMILPACAGKIPLPDSDGDGIPDIIDPCPTNPDPTCVPEPTPPEAYDCANPPALSGLVKVHGAIKDRYIVALKSTGAARAIVSEAGLRGFAARFKVEQLQPLMLVHAFAARIGVAELGRVLADPNVAYVQQEGTVKAVDLSWGLDRIDQREGLDGKFSPLLSGTNVHIYVNDTGVTRTADLGDRLSNDCFSVFGSCEDGHGHGTHVAGTAAGKVWGVAKAAIVHSARFLDKDGSGTDTDAIRTLEWIQAHDPGPGTRKVVNASWGGSPAPALDAAVCRVIESGTVFVAAAGNESTDSRNSTPSRVVQAITAGAVDRNDRMASFSNYGPGVDLFAPGVEIESDTPTGGTAVYSGTSMATPHVVGAAALYLELHRTATPAEVEAGLISESTPDTLSGLPAETPNRLLYVTPTGGTPGETPPKGVPVGAERLLKTSGATVVDQAGKRVDLLQAIACCRTPIMPEGAKPSVRRPRPIRVAGVEINARWPLASPAWMDFTHGYLADAWHFRMGPFYADEETESDWMDLGGPYLPGGLEWNPVFWQAARDYAYHAYKLGGRVEVVVIDTWGCKYSQGGNRYVPWPQDAIDACGRTWHPEHERFARKVVEELGCFGNTYWAVDNEGEGVQGEQMEWFLQLRNVIRDEEQRTGCRFVHPIGTGVRAVMSGVDYSITHVREALVEPLAGHWTVNNERNPAGAPDEEETHFRQARSRGLVWALWRDDMEDGAFYDTLARFKRVVEGSEPPPPPPCTLGTPTAREMAAAGKRPTIKVQRTVAGAGLEPQAGKWISGTPVACFGRDYYCQPDMDWPEACAGPPCPGPVAPEGHPQRVACEAQFLEQPCPTFAQDHCTGSGTQCPISWDTYIVIDGVNQLHPDNVKAGCLESTYVKDPDGRLLTGQWWKATAHGKGYLKACNFDGSACGTSTFEIDQ